MRTVRAVSMMNIVDVYKRVMRSVEIHRTDAIPHDDWAIYKLLTDLEIEDG